MANAEIPLSGAVNQKDVRNEWQAYRNTNLTPEEIKGYREISSEQIKTLETVNENLVRTNMKLSRELSHYRQAEEQGLLIKLPCKVGDTVYADREILFLPYAIGCTKKIVECEVIGFIQTKKQKLIKISPHGLDCYIGRASNKRVAISAIGKTVFFTREAAEQALKGSASE